jgi:multiple sugar transport system substrate-binding protein
MIQEIRRDIISGKYAAGKNLPSESALAKMYQLSNKSVRKGLEQLVDEGLIVKVNRVGNRVIGPGRESAVTVTLGCHESIERDFELQRLLDEFHGQYPSIRVIPVKLTPPAFNANFIQITEPYLANGIVDVFTMNHMAFLEFIENDGLHMLEPLPAINEIYPSLREAFTFEGVQYVQPLVFSPVVLCYNKEHFRKAGVPEPDSTWTWIDVLRAAELLSRPGERHGFYFYLLSENRWPIFLLQSGMGFEWNENGECDIRGTRLLENIRFVKKLIDHPYLFPKYLTESNDDVNQLFIQEKVSMILSTYFSMNELKHTKIPYDISLLPYFDVPAVLTVPIGMAVNRCSRQKDAAMLLVRFMASRKAQQLIRELTVSIPACKPVAEQVGGEKQKINRPPHYSMFREHLPHFRVQKDLNLTNAEFLIVRSLLKKYWSGMIDEDTLCELINTQLRRKS